MRQVYAGVMSGTSLDGVDAVIADFAPGAGGPCKLLAAAHLPFAPDLRDELFALQHRGDDELARAARAANALADAYAAAIVAAVAVAGVSADELIAAGVHGQTLRHRPDEGWTLQLNNPARVAERAGTIVVADFRSRDVAAGGQGAPLVPAFHAALFGGGAHRVVLNIGGIGNLTDLPLAGPVRGFDTGPGNVLLDLWYARHRGGTFDRDGAWSQSGRMDESLLAALLAEPYFARIPPKSTGRDLFDAAWLDAKLEGRAIAPADVQATLVALTARTVADSVRVHCAPATQALVCGGGANNAALMAALARELAPRTVATTVARGVAVEHVEALAFAWLAREAINGRPGNLPAVTGARGPRVLGAIFPR
ncbi:MAG: anhydro-N-acetylmuramic acid kinase [Betaproteobacteria bacterium]